MWTYMLIKMIIMIVSFVIEVLPSEICDIESGLHRTWERVGENTAVVEFVGELHHVPMDIPAISNSPDFLTITGFVYFQMIEVA